MAKLLGFCHLAVVAGIGANFFTNALVSDAFGGGLNGAIYADLAGFGNAFNNFAGNSFFNDHPDDFWGFGLGAGARGRWGGNGGNGWNDWNDGFNGNFNGNWGMNGMNGYYNGYYNNNFYTPSIYSSAYTLPSYTLPSYTLPSYTLPSYTLPSYTLPSYTLPSYSYDTSLYAYGSLPTVGGCWVQGVWQPTCWV